MKCDLQRSSIPDLPIRGKSMYSTKTPIQNPWLLYHSQQLRVTAYNGSQGLHVVLIYKSPETRHFAISIPYPALPDAGEPLLAVRRLFRIKTLPSVGGSRSKYTLYAL